MPEFSRWTQRLEEYMEIDFPSLSGINKNEKYRGPFVLLSWLEGHPGTPRPLYPCGHKSDRARVYRTPDILLPYLSEKSLLAQVGSLNDVVLFDPQYTHTNARGHRVKERCPECFFRDALLAVGPMCPNCRKAMVEGTRVVLCPYEHVPELRSIANILRYKDQTGSWFVACCAPRGLKDVRRGEFVWQDGGLSPL